MLEKKYRLTRKDINFLFKKQKIIPWKYFSFFVWPQWPNRPYNQFSVQIPVKVSKSAVKRNYIKRIAYSFLRDSWLIFKKFWWGFYKIFIVTNKKSIDKLKDLLNSKNIENKRKILIFLRESFTSLKKLEDDNFVKNLFLLQQNKKKEKNTWRK